MVVRVYECSDCRITYGYLTVKKEGITAKEIQTTIHNVKADVSREFEGWSIEDVFEKFPEDWDWEFQAVNEGVAI